MIADRKMRVGGFFTGIGAHHSALERIKARTPGFDYEVVFQGEIDAKTALAYDTIHGPTANLGDIIKVESLDEYRLDLFMVSPPCQDISVAGLGKGATEGSGTRSSLIYEVPRILAATARDRLPEFVVWEDVPNLVSSKFIWVWEDVLARMEVIGYRTVWQVMNAADYGVAQSRKRLFAVSRLDKDPCKVAVGRGGAR